MPLPYSYICRPGYKSTELLIEFTRGMEDINFFPSIIEALAPIEAKVVGMEDRWISDDVQYQLSTTIGNLYCAFDIWGFAFMTAEGPNSLIEQADKLLSDSPLFVKEIAQLGKYETPSQHTDHD